MCETLLDADSKLSSIFLPHQEGPVRARHQQVLGCSSVHVPCKPGHRIMGKLERRLNNVKCEIQKSNYMKLRCKEHLF